MASADTAVRLASVVGRLSRRLRGGGVELSYGLLSALATIAKDGPLRLADLAQLEQISAPSTTRLVSELESQGLVSRRPDPVDGRAVLISITPSGKDAVARARAARGAIMQQLFATLSPEELAAIEAALPALERAEST